MVTGQLLVTMVTMWTPGESKRERKQESRLLTRPSRRRGSSRLPWRPVRSGLDRFPFRWFCPVTSVLCSGAEVPALSDSTSLEETVLCSDLRSQIFL